MKNLKKVLAFALVVCMMLTTIVSATAISAQDFSDTESIGNVDAVAVLTELGVINGYPDGSFKPEKTVSRAEMAKMITVILNKGTEAAGNYDGAQVFSDVYADMWCKGYVNYCNTLGIVVGMGDGTFAPNKGVTVAQAAKMLLVAMGYDPVVEGFEGDNWLVNVNSVAAKAGLYDGVTANAQSEASRDVAALLIYNALVANTVDGYVNGKAVVGEKTMLGIYFNAVVVTGVVVANDHANLFGEEPLYNAKYDSTELAILGAQYIDDKSAVDPQVKVIRENKEVKYVDNDDYVTYIFRTETSLSQVGQTVKVIAKLKDNYDYYYVDGVRYLEYTFNGEVVGKAIEVPSVAKEFKGEYNLFNARDLKKEGVTTDETTRYFVNYATSWNNFGVPARYNIESKDTNSGKYDAADAIFYNADGEYTKLVDVDGDGVSEIAIKLRPFFAVAEYDDYFDTYTFDTLDADGKKDNSSANIATEDVISEKEIKDGDKVLVTPIDGTFYVTVAEQLKGAPTSVSVDAEEKDYVVIDGEKVYESGLYWSYSTYEDSIDAGNKDNELKYDLSKTEPDKDYIFYLDGYGNVVAYEADKGPKAESNYALVTGAFVDNNGVNKDADYFLELTLAGQASKVARSLTEVQWMGSRNPYLDEEAVPFFGDDNAYGINLFDVKNVSSYTKGAYTALINAKLDKDGHVDVGTIDPLTKLKGEDVFSGQWRFETEDGGYAYATSDTAIFVYKYSKTDDTKDVFSVIGDKNMPKIEGITSMYAVVDKDKSIEAIVIETSGIVEKTSTEYVFIYNVLSITGSGQNVRYEVEGVDRDGKQVTFTVDGLHSEGFKNYKDADYKSGKFDYGIYAKTECIDVKDIFDIEKTNFSFFNTVETSSSSINHIGEYVDINGARYYLEDDTAVFIRAAVEYNTKVSDFQLATSDLDKISKHTSSMLVIYKDAVNAKGDAYKSIVAVIGSVDHPMVYNAKDGIYAERGTIVAGDAEYMTGGKNVGSFNYFQNIVKAKAKDTSEISTNLTQKPVSE